MLSAFHQTQGYAAAATHRHPGDSANVNDTYVGTPSYGSSGNELPRLRSRFAHVQAYAGNAGSTAYLVKLNSTDLISAIPAFTANLGAGYDNVADRLCHGHRFGTH